MYVTFERKQHFYRYSTRDCTRELPKFYFRLVEPIETYIIMTLRFSDHHHSDMPRESHTAPD